MPVIRRRLAVLAAAGLLAAPAPALGQSAGDEQYEDPFAGENQSQGGGSQEPAAPASPEPTAPPAPAAESASSGQGTEPAAQTELPYTGADAGAVLLAGSLLLAGGIALRVRLRERS